jgi:hypothetical protein
MTAPHRLAILKFLCIGAQVIVGLLPRCINLQPKIELGSVDIHTMNRAAVADDPCDLYPLMILCWDGCSRFTILSPMRNSPLLLSIPTLHSYLHWSRLASRIGDLSTAGVLAVIFTLLLTLKLVWRGGCARSALPVPPGGQGCPVAEENDFGLLKEYRQSPPGHVS